MNYLVVEPGGRDNEEPLTESGAPNIPIDYVITWWSERCWLWPDFWEVWPT